MLYKPSRVSPAFKQLGHLSLVWGTAGASCWKSKDWQGRSREKEKRDGIIIYLYPAFGMGMGMGDSLGQRRREMGEGGMYTVLDPYNKVQCLWWLHHTACNPQYVY